MDVMCFALGIAGKAGRKGAPFCLPYSHHSCSFPLFLPPYEFDGWALGSSSFLRPLW